MIILLLTSLIVVRSVVPEEFIKHLAFILVALAAFFFVSKLDYRILSSWWRLSYILGIFMLTATFIFGQITRGAVRWIEIGPLTVQPSELSKPLMILFLAGYLQNKNIKKLRALFPLLLLTAIPVWLVFKQPDLGSSMVISVVGLSVLIAAGVQPWLILVLILTGLASLPAVFQMLKPYQKERLQAFFNPFSDPLGSGYSLIQSMIAVGSGMLFGRGLGHGTQSQLRFLPERHSDFIFASLAEELGFIGATLVLASYFVLLSRLLTIAKETDELSGTLVSVGVFSMLLFQIVVNIGMNLGLLPITGITLPLVSTGGSSMLATLVSLGLVQSVGSRNKPPTTIEIR